jgi:hypothetical protein
MYDTAVFRKRAQHCIRQANKLGLARRERTRLLLMAARWNEVADDAERLLIGDAARMAVIAQPHLDS